MFSNFKLFSQIKSIITFDNIENTGIESSISFDGTKIVYISYIDGLTKLFEVEKDSQGKWTSPKPLSEINSAFAKSNIGSPVYNYNATRVYFESDYNIDSSGVDIFYSDRTKTGWTAPQSIGIPINTLGYDGEPSISADDLSFYFVRQDFFSETPSLNCKRIMVTERTVGGTWSEPQTLPEPINLICERTPRILSDNKTLLFSSIREGGKGGYDLYFAKQITKNVWQLPIAIDTVNTEGNELFPSVSYFGESLYFNILEYKKVNILGNILETELPSEFRPEKNMLITGTITNSTTNEPVKSSITVYNPKSSVVLMTSENNSTDGKYSFLLPHSKEYLIDYTASDYSHVFEKVSTLNLSENKTFTKDVSLFSNVYLLLNVFDKDIFQPQAAKITVKDSKNNKIENTEIETLDVGRFGLTLPLGKKYIIEVEQTYFDNYSMEFDLTGIIQFDEFERDIELTSQKKKVEFFITDADSKEGVLVEIEIVNLNTNEKYTTYAFTDANGKAVIELRQGDNYEVNMSPKGYAFYNTTLNLDDNDFSTNVNVQLTPLNTSTKLELNNITFETNSDALNSSSFVELERVMKLMNDNPNIKIEISAHTDNVGSDVYNLKLSDKRAQSVVNYLVDNGITLERMIAKGYGESLPLFSNDTDENKAKNRRVELKIIEI